MSRRTFVALLCALGVLGLSGSATGGGFASFRLPSKRIGCMYGALPGSTPAIRCDVLGSGLSPRPKAKCPGDWVGLALGAKGRARPV